MSAIAGLVVGATLGTFDDRRRFLARTVTGLIVGSGIGVVTWAADLDLEFMVATLALAALVLTWWSLSEG